MPDIRRVVPDGKEYFEFSGAENFCLQEAFRGAVCSWMLTVKDVTGGGTFSFDLKGVCAGYGLPYTDADDIGYQKLDETTIDIAAGTAISAGGNYIVRGDGMDVWLGLTAISAGTVEVYVTPLLG